MMLWLLLTRIVWTTSAGRLSWRSPPSAATTAPQRRPGLIIAVWGAASMVGGVLHGGRRRQSSLQARFVLLLVLLVAAFPLALARSTLEVALVVSLFGLGVAPWLASADTLTQAAAPQRTLTEAFAWAMPPDSSVRRSAAAWPVPSSRPAHQRSSPS